MKKNTTTPPKEGLIKPLPVDKNSTATQPAANVNIESMVSDVKTVEPDLNKIPAKKEEEEEQIERRLLSEFIEPYLLTYPEEKEFHITGDGQVFLKRNAADAVAHQKQLDSTKEVFIYLV